MEGFQINYTDLSDLFWEYKRKIENLIENIDNCIEKINMFTENAVFTGKTGDAVKSYLGEAHITILSGIKVTAQTLLDNMAAYKDGYRAIDSSTNFKLDEEAIQEFREKASYLAHYFSKKSSPFFESKGNLKKKALIIYIFRVSV